MERSAAYALLPADAEWSCSFGNPGDGGFAEFHLTKAGERWQITNGSYDLPSFALDWQCKEIPA